MTQTALFSTVAPPPAVTKDALISPCGQYRYWLNWLTRKWDAAAHKLPIIMLNPSTADAALDDPTIRRCMAFAGREGFGGVRVMNLFAFRATSPGDMKAARDPIGPNNFRHIATLLERAAKSGTPILAAWGVLGGHRANVVRQQAREVGARLVCLGTTKEGHPRHPLYVKGDQPFEGFPCDS